MPVLVFPCTYLLPSGSDGSSTERFLVSLDLTYLWPYWPWLYYSSASSSSPSPQSSLWTFWRYIHTVYIVISRWHMHSKSVDFSCKNNLSVLFPLQKPRWLRHFVPPLTAVFREEVKWWSGVELGRRFLFLLFFIPFPRNAVRNIQNQCLLILVCIENAHRVCGVPFLSFYVKNVRYLCAWVVHIWGMCVVGKSYSQVPATTHSCLWAWSFLSAHGFAIGSCINEKHFSDFT